MLPELSFKIDDFRDILSTETFDFHYNKHHKTYVNNLNNLIEKSGENSNWHNSSLEKVIIDSSQNNNNIGIFNNAAQIWNHSFYWNSIKPYNENDISHKNNFISTMEKHFGSFDNFVQEFKKKALGNFGSGWTWLVYSKTTEKIEIINSSNAGTIVTEINMIPIITCDVWEHAYYIDHRNNRGAYVDLFLEKMINYDFANQNIDKAINH
ncbi:MAG TPA: superoxide dismutase [Candidatus Megaira endosymbiont of Hartmannula sinica]|nr:superoxide dismutase [Candidatus Megaera endosymbiont of Hartmannula sinica]